MQDSKIHKGELFGISNLFRDLSKTVFTSDIIEKHDERIIGIHRSSSGSGSKPIVRIEEADFEDISNSSREELEDDIEDSAATEVMSDSGDEIENSESQYDHLLKDAGKQLGLSSTNLSICMLSVIKLLWHLQSNPVSDRALMIGLLFQDSLQNL